MSILATFLLGATLLLLGATIHIVNLNKRQAESYREPVEDSQ